MLDFDTVFSKIKELKSFNHESFNELLTSPPLDEVSIVELISLRDSDAKLLLERLFLDEDFSYDKFKSISKFLLTKYLKHLNDQGQKYDPELLMIDAFGHYDRSGQRRKSASFTKGLLQLICEVAQDDLIAKQMLTETDINGDNILLHLIQLVDFSGIIDSNIKKLIEQILQLTDSPHVMKHNKVLFSNPQFRLMMGISLEFDDFLDQTTDYQGRGMLTHWVLRVGGFDADNLKELQKSDANFVNYLHQKDINGRSAFHYSLLAGDSDTLNFLIEQGNVTEEQWHEKPQENRVQLSGFAMALYSKKIDLIVRILKDTDYPRLEPIDSILFDICDLEEFPKSLDEIIKIIKGWDELDNQQKMVVLACIQQNASVFLTEESDQRRLASDIKKYVYKMLQPDEIEFNQFPRGMGLGVEIEVSYKPEHGMLPTDVAADWFLLKTDKDHTIKPLPTKEKIEGTEFVVEGIIADPHLLNHFFYGLGIMNSHTPLTTNSSTGVHVHYNISRELPSGTIIDDMGLNGLDTDQKKLIQLAIVKQAIVNWRSIEPLLKGFLRNGSLWHEKNSMIPPFTDAEVAEIMATESLEDLKKLRTRKMGRDGELKYHAMNPFSAKGSIEFRMLEGSSDPVIIKSWINFIHRFMEMTKEQVAKKWREEGSVELMDFPKLDTFEEANGETQIAAPQKNVGAYPHEDIEKLVPLLIAERGYDTTYDPELGGKVGSIEQSAPLSGYEGAITVKQIRQDLLARLTQTALAGGDIKSLFTKSTKLYTKMLKNIPADKRIIAQVNALNDFLKNMEFVCKYPGLNFNLEIASIKESVNDIFKDLAIEAIDQKHVDILEKAKIFTEIYRIFVQKLPEAEQENLIDSIKIAENFNETVATLKVLSDSFKHPKGFNTIIRKHCDGIDPETLVAGLKTCNGNREKRKFLSQNIPSFDKLSGSIQTAIIKECPLSTAENESLSELLKICSKILPSHKEIGDGSSAILNESKHNIDV